MSYIYQGKNYSAVISKESFSVLREDRTLVDLIPCIELTRVESFTGPDGNEEFREICETCETLLSFEAIDSATYRWKSRSDLWEKEYTLRLDSDGFTFTPTVTGKGAAGRLSYFKDPTEVNGRAVRGSAYDFCEYTFPCPATHAHIKMTRTAVENYRSFFELLIPPPYVYSFRFSEMEGRLGLGLVAKEGGYNYIHFDYTCEHVENRGNVFILSTDLEGHTKINGACELPSIRSFFGEDDIDIVRRYSEYHFESGLCRKSTRGNEPRWWYGPIICGWNEQILHLKEGEDQKDLANQETYEMIADMIDEYGIRASVLIIDDKWQKGYGDCVPDPKKWPDMRAFTDKMHERGIHTLLWFRLWGGGGLEDDEIMYGEGMPYNEGRVRLDYGPYADPTNEKYRERLKKTLYLLLSSDEGCMNCDGFKLDYSLVMPYGKTARSAGGIYGAELTKAFYDLIYKTAKEIKPDCLINGSPCHPYFDEVCDQARLHDYSWGLRNETEVMGYRARLFDAAMPGVLIDTDSPNYANRADAMRYIKAMPRLGIPDLYRFSNGLGFNLTDADWDEIRRIFNTYAEEMDKKPRFL